MARKTTKTGSKASKRTARTTKARGTTARRKAPARKATARKTTARKTAARRKPPVRRKTTARKAAARKTAARRKTPVRRKSTARKTAARRKTTARKATARKTTARKTAARKTTARRKTAVKATNRRAAGKARTVKRTAAKSARAKKVKDIDPITLQVIGGALHTAAKEMGHVLYRMSFSSIIRESEDLGAGLFDADFNTLSESDSTPLHIGSIPGYLQGIQDTLQDGEWYEGDVVIHNHPYHGASHSPDILVAIPIFWEGKIVGFSANTAHHIDIGSATPGLIIDIPDVFAEGMLFAGIKLYRKGVRNEGLWKFMGNNSRMATMLRDDIEAQVASARLGVERFKDLIRQYGLSTLQAACNQLMDYTERMMRQQIRKIPDGTYRADGWLDDDGRNRGKRLRVKVAVIVKGDNVTVDLTGSADQVPTGYNVPFEGSTKVAVFCCFRSLLLDQAMSEVYIPQNQGSFRPIKVIAPKGSIFNPEYPAAAEARFTQCNRIIDCIIEALAPVLPDRVTAGNSASLSFIAYAGLRPSGDYWVFLEVNEGSYGARATSDGPDSIDNLMCNTRNNPLEDLGMHLPMVCERYELRDDVMPGAGKHRGGIGVVKAQRVLTASVITHENDRHTDVPKGVFGGAAGAVGKVQQYNYKDPGKVTELPAKVSGVDLAADDVIAFYGPCGGGYGNPLERSAEQVLDDVLDDFCTIDQALSAYGVVITDTMQVDKAATSARRAEMGKVAAE